MKRYKHRPTIVEAVQWDGTQESMMRISLLSANTGFSSQANFAEDSDNVLHCWLPSFKMPPEQTKLHNFALPKGDYMVRSDLEFMPVKKDLFEQLYEECEEY